MDDLRQFISSASVGDHHLPKLPPHACSLLKLKVSVVATLASKKEPIGEIVRLVPGTIIHFAKSCDEMLELEVGDARLAVGEAVNVDDKYGLRITSMQLPNK